MRQIGQYLGFDVATISRQLSKAKTHKWSSRVNSWAKKIFYYDLRKWNKTYKETKQKRIKKLNKGLENKYVEFIKFTKKWLIKES